MFDPDPLEALTRRLSTDRPKQSLRQIQTGIGSFVILIVVATDPVLAQSVSDSFCDTALVKTGKNILTVIQFGGPLLGTILAVGASVVQPAIRRSDHKKEIKDVRSQALIWGIIVAPLSITIVQFLLNSVVAGGASCGF